MPHMDTLHAILLLAWSEYKNERIPSEHDFYLSRKLAITDAHNH